mgnify:FL=1
MTMEEEKFCVNCKHFAKEDFFVVCGNPKLGKDPVYGNLITILARNCRESNIACGSSGKWFEQKELVFEDVKEKTKTFVDSLFDFLKK